MNMLTKLSQSSHNLGASLSTLIAGHVVFVLQRTETVEKEMIQVMTLLADNVLTQERLKQTCIWFQRHSLYPWLIEQWNFTTVVHVHE